MPQPSQSNSTLRAAVYSAAYKRYVTLLMLVVYVLNQTDRAIFGFLMEPIKRELELSDSQLGFLAGPALVLFYATVGIPIARFADRSNRVNIIATAVAMWSVVVTLSAAVASWGQLALARVAVGIGEAGFSAIAQSLLSDYHSSTERTRALSIFMLAIPMGSVVSSLMGGWLNEVYGWRAAFVFAGVPGILASLLVKLSVREPRSAHTVTTASNTPQPRLRTVFATLWRCKALRHLAIGMALINMVCASFLTWAPTFFVRSHGMTTGELGTWLAVAIAGGGSLGTWLGGHLVSRYGAADVRVQARLLAIGAALVTPLLAAVLMWPSKRVALSLLLPAYALMFFSFGPSFSLVQGLVPAHVRATITAIVILGQSLFAGVFGLQLVGVMSDAFSRASAADSLQWALFVVSLAGIWAGSHFWLSARSIRRDFADASDGDQPRLETIA